jgi:hypothetical protein
MQSEGGDKQGDAIMGVCILVHLQVVSYYYSTSQ